MNCIRCEHAIFDTTYQNCAYGNVCRHCVKELTDRKVTVNLWVKKNHKTLHYKYRNRKKKEKAQ